MVDCRKWKHFSFSEKLNIFRELDKKVGPRKALAERLKNSCKIRKSLKVTPPSVLEYDPVEWFNIVFAKKVAISGLLIKEKHNVKKISASNRSDRPF